MKKNDLLFYMFWVGVCLFCLLGCGPLINPTPLTVRIPAQTDYTAVFSWETASLLADTLNPNPGPTPTPNKPKVGDSCPTCYGTGKSGDGIQTCFQCKGDGKVDEGDPILGNTTPTPAVEEKPSTLEEKPITILVEKYETLYAVNLDGLQYVWDGQVFTNTENRIHIQPAANFDPSTQQFIRVCDGASCRQIPIEKIVRSINDRPQSTTKPSNGSG